MTSAPFVSVNIPVYNNPDGVDLLLGGLAAQTYARDSYEVIVADNGSTDETPSVIDCYVKDAPDLVRVVSEDEIQGSYAARNKGIAAARGKILAFIDSDCDPALDWVEQGVAGLDSRSAAAGGGRIEFTFAADTPNVYEYLDSARKLDQKNYVEVSGFAATANFFARSSLFGRCGVFRPDLVSGGDYEFGRRMTRAGEKLVYMPEAVVRHPARDTFHALLQKSKRIAVGKKRLQELGLLEHGKLSVRQLVPILSWPKDGRWDQTLTTTAKLRLLLLQNYFLMVRWWIENPVR